MPDHQPAPRAEAPLLAPSRPPATAPLPRRRWLGRAGALCLALQLRPALAVSETPSLEAMVQQWAAGRPLNTGRITLNVPELVENGNAVPLAVKVDSPMRGNDRVLEVMVFNELNPQRELVRFEFGLGSPRAEAATRVRLATSQRLVALARMADGSQWQQQVDVIVTLAACVEV